MLKLQYFFQYPNFINERQFLLCTENVRRNILMLLKYWSWYHFKCTLSFGIITKALLFGIKPSYISHQRRAIFFIKAFFHGRWRLTGQQKKEEDHHLSHTTTYTRSRTFRHLFTTLTPCVYQTATRWDLPLYKITIWLIDDVILIYLCLLDDLILGFCYSYLAQDTGELEFVSTIALLSQVNRLTKCASQPRGLLRQLKLSPIIWNLFFT